MDFLEIDGTRLECRRVGPAPEEAPTIVFLHEGLGSVSTWRDFPDALVVFKQPVHQLREHAVAEIV